MPTITITVGAVPSAMPAAFHGTCVTPAIWNELKNGIDKSRNDACCTACAVEWGVCVLTGCFCIFCCHKCIEDNFTKADMTCASLNNTYFQGKSVFNSLGTNITINTDNFQPQQQVPPQYQQQPAVIYAQPVQDSAQMAAPIAPGGQMSVTIPPGIAPGSSLQVQSPTGQMIVVTVPPGTMAGQTIQVAC